MPLVFAKIIAPLCSCGRELGVLQSDIELNIPHGSTLAQYLTDLGIVKICCRRTIMVAPTYMINSANENAFIDETKKVPTKSAPPPRHLPFPSLPVLPGLASTEVQEHIAVQQLPMPSKTTIPLNITITPGAKKPTRRT